MIKGKGDFNLSGEDATPRRVREIVKLLGHARYQLRAEGTWISSSGDPIWTRNNVNIIEVRRSGFVLDLEDEGEVSALPDKNDGSLRLKVET